MFEVGDVVTCVRVDGLMRNPLVIGQDYVVGEVTAKYLRIDGVLYLKNRFVPKQPDAVKRLRVIQAYRPAGLRLGAIVTVKKEHATTYLLEEHPGRLFKKERFELVVDEPAPVQAAPKGVIPRAVKVGDKIKVADVHRATAVSHDKGNPWGRTDTKVELGQILTVKHAREAQHNGFNGVAINVAEREYFNYIYPLDAFVFADGSPIDKGYVIKERPVDKNVKKGDMVVVKAIDREWAGGYHKLHDTLEAIIGKPLEVRYNRNEHHEGDYVMLADATAFNKHKYVSIAFPIKDLVYADGAITNAAPPAPVKKVLEDPFKLVQGAKINTLCQYVYLEKGKDEYTKDFDAPCYASWGRIGSPISRLIIGMNKPYRHLPERSHDAFNRWLEYVVERSPFRSSFVTKTAEEAKKGLEMDCNKSIDELMCSAIAMRDGYEHYTRLVPFTHFLDEGYSEHTAYILAFCLSYNDGAWGVTSMSDGHSNMSGTMEMADVIKFFREGYNRPELKNLKPANVDKNSRSYWVGKCIAEMHMGAKDSMKDFVIRESGAKLDGAGWGQRIIINEKNVKQLADKLEQLITA